MFLKVMQWLVHCIKWQIDSVRVFVWAPVGEFPGRRFWFGCGFFVCLDSINFPTPRTFYPCNLYFLLTHVRTEPLRGKKMHPSEIYTVAGVVLFLGASS